MNDHQLSLDFGSEWSNLRSPVVAAAIDELSAATEIDSRGAIFTRREVVDFMLDLAGYAPDRPLHRLRFLEPSFGEGSFLLRAVDRLLKAWKAAGGRPSSAEDLSDAIRAIELHEQSFTATLAKLMPMLIDEGIAPDTAARLADRWLIRDDFLLAPIDGRFDFVVGNPPYVRQELIAAPLLAEYRSRYRTMYDRADIYIPFIERSLSMLAQGGTLGFICSDRWMKNRYGGPLRRLIAANFHLKAYVDMVDTPAFSTDVIAYPAITIIGREPAGPTRIARRPAIDSAELSQLASVLTADTIPEDAQDVRELSNIASSAQPWLLDPTDQTEFVRRLEAEFPLLEEVCCKVGIGVATGADKAFIGPFHRLNVEPDRKLPLVTTKDIVSGEVQWQGLGVINPFKEGGGLVDLRDYPLLREYLEQRRDVITARHCAQKTPSNWYRTIDRITPSLAAKPKLLIPDIKGEAHVVFEAGDLYPHHNLYFVTSDEWDLRALQAVLLSSVTRHFIRTYSTTMRGGFLRFQAQYLRRLRLPRWANVPNALRKRLADAAIARDIEACNRAAFDLYGMSDRERATVANRVRGAFTRAAGFAPAVFMKTRRG